MIENGKKTHFSEIIYGWICDIQNRFVGLEGMVALYKTHMEFIVFINEDLDEATTFEEYKQRCTELMSSHAIARNDIYDNQERKIYLDENGLIDETNGLGVWVSREEHDLRYLLAAWIAEEE